MIARSPVARPYDVACVVVVLLATGMIGAGLLLARVADETALRQFEAHVEDDARQLAHGLEWQIGQSLRDPSRPPARLLHGAELPPAVLAAIVADDGTVLAWRTPEPRSSPRSVAGSAMFCAIGARSDGLWTGPSPGDGVVRVDAFRRLPQRGLTLVVGLELAASLAPARAWARTIALIAIARSAVVALVATLAIVALRAARAGVLGDARERSQLAAAKDMAEAREAQLHALLGGMSDGVTLLDADRRLLLWNERFAGLGLVPRSLLRPGAALMQSLLTQGEGEGETGIGEVLAACTSHGGSGTLPHPQRPEGGIEFRCRVLPDGGCVTLFTDVTERRQRAAAQAEAQRLTAEAAERRTQFVAFVSHEIRAPLGALLGSLALLDRASLSPAQRALALAAREAGAGLLALVQDVLEMSALDAPEPAIRRVTFAWRPLLASVIAVFSRTAEARGLLLAVEIAPDLPVRLCADPGRLRQVLSNLLANAVKFSAPGRVVVQAERTASPPRLRLSVCDPGPTIPAQEAALLFRPFSRPVTGRGEGTPGTGLGLAICARLMALMGGQIGVAPTPEGGNAFWLTLPLPLPLPVPDSATSEARTGVVPSPSAAQDELAVFDDAYLAMLRQAVPVEVFTALMQGCLTEARERVPVLQAALSAGDAEAVRRVAHALAGLAGGYGLAAVGRQARTIETAGAVDDLAAAAAAAAALPGELDRAWAEAERLSVAPSRAA